MLEKWRHRLLGGLAGLVSHRPIAVLIVAGLLTAAAVAIAVGWMTFNSNRNDLISPELDWNQRFIEWQDHFPGNADLVIVVDQYRDGREDPDTRAAARKLVDELSPAIAKLDSVNKVIWGFDAEEVSPKAVRLEPLPTFDQRIGQMIESEALLESPTPQALFSRFVAEMQQGEDDVSDDQAEAGLREVTHLVDVFTQRMQTPVDEPFDLGERVEADSDDAGWQYLETPNGRLLIIRITPQKEINAITPYERTLREIRQLMAEAAETYPAVEMGLTGIEVVEADETDAATVDSTWASLLATVLIAVLLITAFHSVRTPLMLMVALGVGIAWTFGFLTLTVGYLQVISVVFTVILLGLGVAFGIHIVSRFELMRHDYSDDEAGFTATIRDTFDTIGPGVVTGAITTAAAFCTTMLTDFRGVAEMGLIAAGGIILCLIAMFSVFPALLRLFKWRRNQVMRVKDRRIQFFEERWVSPFVKHPRFTLAGAAVVAAFSLAAISQMRFDYNLMELLPEGIDSIAWADRLQTDGGESIYFGVSIVDNAEEAREKGEAFRALPSVGSLGGIGLLVPEDDDRKIEIIDAARQTLQPAIDETLGGHEAPEPEASLPQQLGGMRALFRLFAGQVPDTIRPAFDGFGESIDRFTAAANELPEDERDARLDALQEGWTAWRRATAQRIARALDPSPLQLDDLPAAILAPSIGDYSGQTRYELSVFPAPGEGVEVLSPGFLDAFITDMRTVDPGVTGVIVQVYESGTLIWQSYLKAGVYALVAVFVLVWIDFRKVNDALLALVPVAVGFAVTFGIMWLVGQQINPANIIVLPLMFGIGVDAGVHILHRYRMDPLTRPLGLTAGTGKGITLTSFTAIVGFGSLMIARHRGIQSLGFVMAVGIAMTLLACWIVMPAWLELRTRRRTAEE